MRHAADAHDALVACRSFLPDLVLLDIMLPGKSGFELCGLMRQGGRRAVIMVTAKSQRGDKIRGLELGADDYVTKPFDIQELVARIHAVLRRTTGMIDEIRIGHVTINFRDLRATGPDGDVHLTHREFEVLQYLAAASESNRPSRPAPRGCLGRGGRFDHAFSRLCDCATSGRRSKKILTIRDSFEPCTAMAIASRISRWRRRPSYYDSLEWQPNDPDAVLNRRSSCRMASNTRRPHRESSWRPLVTVSWECQSASSVEASGPRSSG